MAWAVELSRAAEKEFERFPSDVRERLGRAIDEMESDPFRSNVKALKGPKWSGRFRKKVGPYRITFTADQQRRTVGISAILIRSKSTYW
jgi:mRNA-degrading endonuclease RelE of RelBE toxin-antitoxin system